MLSIDREETREQRRSRQRQEQRSDQAFAKAHNAATSYGAALRQYAKQISRIIEYHSEGEPPIVPPHRMPELNEALRKYTVGIQPWARAATARMLAEVDRRNRTAWALHASEMSFQLRNALATAPIGPAVQGLLAQQVDLITSLPIEASRYVQERSLQALHVGSRYPEREGEVEEALAAAHPAATDRWLKARATLIARTETARSASVLTQARAEHVGATQYMWLTAGDARVRLSHRRLNKRVFAWDDPPLCDPPDHYANPGQIWNCRCVALPILGPE